ncbi:hypothetical protein ACFL5O_10600 [Myxococcota bacterium]
MLWSLAVSGCRAQWWSWQAVAWQAPHGGGVMTARTGGPGHITIINRAGKMLGALDDQGSPLAAGWVRSVGRHSASSETRPVLAAPRVSLAAPITIEIGRHPSTVQMEIHSASEAVAHGVGVWIQGAVEPTLVRELESSGSEVSISGHHPSALSVREWKHPSPPFDVSDRTTDQR